MYVLHFSKLVIAVLFIPRKKKLHSSTDCRLDDGSFSPRPLIMKG